jgi:hypothetical protein
MKRFVVDFGGEEEMPGVAPEVPPDYDGSFLPRYILTGDENQNWATNRAKEQYLWTRGKSLKDMQHIPEMWLVKVLLVASHPPGAPMEWKEEPVVTWSIATNEKSIAEAWYYLDTEGIVPALLGERAIVTDSRGWRGIIEVASLPERAPWWEPAYKQGALEDIYEMLRNELSIGEIDQLADRLGIIFAHGINRERMISILLDEFTILQPDTVDSIESYIQDYIDTRMEDLDDDD